MHSIRYLVRIKYTNLDGEPTSQDYSFLAESADDAKKIARILFTSDFGNFGDVKMGVKVITPSQEEINMVNRQLIDVYGAVKGSFENLSYKEFLNNYKNFNGYNLRVASHISEFTFEFRGFTCRAVLQDGVSRIDESEIIFNATNSRVYVIRDECTSVLIGN